MSGERLKKIYICSSLRPENHARVTEILKQLPPAIHLRPYIEQIGNKLGHIESDIAMLYYCDEVWVVGEFGRDCAFEQGFATGIGKAMVIFRDEKNKERLDSDWMVLHAVTKGLAKIVQLEDAVREEANRRERENNQ